ncbi:MAG: hypothetical protein WKF42_09935 [Solirubrobacteraceae bacterium]
MDEQEWMRRIDEHLDTSKAYMREGNELMARNERAFVDLQAYLREATAALGMIVAELREGRREQTEGRREQTDSWQEWREESRAVRNALFAILDRMANEPPPSAA